jgi:hypothetical protein
MCKSEPTARLSVETVSSRFHAMSIRCAWNTYVKTATAKKTGVLMT